MQKSICLKIHTSTYSTPYILPRSDPIVPHSVSKIEPVAIVPQTIRDESAAADEREMCGVKSGPSTKGN